MQIAIGVPLGYPAASAKVAGFFTYLLNDTFMTDRVAGAVNGTAPEPGPGRRVVVDTETKMAISGGALVCTGGKASPAYNDPYLYYPMPRTAGRMAIFSVVVNNTTSRSVIGFGQAAPGTAQCTAIFLINAEIRADSGAGFTWVVVGTLTVATHKFAVVQRAVGGFHFQWVGGNPILLWIDSAETAGDSVGIGNYNATYSYEYMKVPAERWLPAPLASDGFSTWGTTDGLGHAEGIVGGLGSGGSGKAWTANVGSWGASGGVAAATALSGGQAIATVDAGKADLIATINCTFNSGTMSLIVRWVDSSNYVQVRLTSTNCQLVKIVAGVSTTVSDIAYTYVAGAELRVICQGSTFRRFYNNAAIGAESTVADAALQSATRIGLRTDNVGNSFDNLRAYARGTGGEYAALDNY